MVRDGVLLLMLRPVLQGILLLLTWASPFHAQITELPIPAAGPLSMADGRPGMSEDQHRIAYVLAIDHLNEDNMGLPYRFVWKPMCDTQQTVLRGYACAVEMNDFSPVGIAGAFYSSVTLHMVVIATQHRLLQCSPAASSPDLSEQKYPYFFRTMATDDSRATGIIAMMQHFEWWRAAAIHATDRFAAGLAEKLARGAVNVRNKSKTIDFAFHTLEPNFYSTLSPDVIMEVRDDLVFSIRQSQIRIIIAILLEGELYTVLRWAWEAGFMSADYAWIGTTSFTFLSEQDSLQQMDSGELPPREQYANFLTVTSRLETTNRTLRLRASALERYNKNMTADLAILLYDCVVAIGKAVETLLQRNRSLSPSHLVGKREKGVAQQLRDTAFNLEFEGASGWVSFAKPKSANAGDRIPVFSILKWMVVSSSWEEVAVYSNSSIRFIHAVNFSGAAKLFDSSLGCEPGTEFNPQRSFQERRDVCEPCPKGRHRNGRLRTPCRLCPAGFMCDDDVNGTQDPKSCEPGQYSTGGAYECTNCARGRHSELPAASKCEECHSGFYQNSSGATRCNACPMGFFQAERGGTDCRQCPETQGTEVPASKSRGSCGCPVGFRWASDRGRCLMCRSAMLRCGRFNSTPLVMPGYYLQEAAPRDLEHLELFRCSEPDWCPGEDELGDSMCAEAREGLNCGRCSHGFYQSGQSCHACKDHHTLLYILGFIALFVASGLMMHFWNARADEVEVSEGLFLSITVGTALAVVQRLGVIGMVGVAWPREIKDVLSLCSGFLSSFVILTPSCALPPSLFSMYLARLCAPLLFVLCCLLWWGLSQLLHRWASRRIPAFSIFQVVNTTGLVISALYIYAAMGTFSLVDCYENPNGKRTIREFPFALCSGPDFESALPLFALGVLIYIVGMAGVTLYALWVAPVRYRRGSGFRVMIRFLVYKFRPDKYWYGLVMMSMSFLMALVTVVFPDSMFLQLLCMKVVAASQLFAHCLNMPYSQNYANVVETGEYLGLVILLSLGSYFFQEPLGYDIFADLSRCILILFTIMAGLVLCAFCWGLYLALCPKRTASRRRSELDSQVDCILAGCQEILGDPNGFRQLLSQASSYVERERAARIMSFFNNALATQRENSEQKRGTTRRLFLSLLRRSGSIRPSDASAVSQDGYRPKGSASPQDEAQGNGQFQGCGHDEPDPDPDPDPHLARALGLDPLLVPSKIVEMNV